MDADEGFLGSVEEVRTTEDIDQVNIALSKGWVIIKISESILAWDDGGKSSRVTYHMGRPKKLPI
ncbi:hypothetical protein GR294_23235 [Raoultella sp. Lac2]|uniref:hypothetical protein n=1 Tax=unclassified Raoultella TaxID=2627600 RepID=UPI00135454C8|nr:hypothetical protein [Raoultella sp. Lac2]MXF98734.1 hypothetical protein [Raoultella sp. Lac1]